MNEEIEFPGRPDQRNPVTRAAFRRQVWVQIYLPLALGVVLLAGIVFGLWSTDVAELSAWADASTMLLILPVLAISVIPLLLAAGAVYLVQLLIKSIPGPAHRAQVFMREVSRQADRASELATRPWVAAEGVSAAARRGWARLTSVFQSKR